MKSLTTLLLALVLTACGGGGGSEAPASAPTSMPVVAAPAPAPAPAVVVKQLPSIVFFGDSTGVGAGGTRSPVQVAQDILHTTIRNEAISGSSALQLLTGTDGSGKSFAERIAGAQVVVIMHAHNDERRSEDLFVSILRQLVAQARAAGATVMLVTPTADLPSIGEEALVNQAFADAIMREAATMGTLTCNVHRKMIDNGIVDPRYYHDNDPIHMNDDGYAFVGTELASCLAPLAY